MINVIFDGGSSRAARKKHMWTVKNSYAVNTTKRRMPEISFTNTDFHVVDTSEDNLIVNMVEVSDFVVKKTLVNKGNSIYILYLNTFRLIGLP